MTMMTTNDRLVDRHYVFCLILHMLINASVIYLTYFNECVWRTYNAVSHFEVVCNDFVMTTMAFHVGMASNGYPRAHVVCNYDDGKLGRYSD